MAKDLKKFRINDNEVIEMKHRMALYNILILLHGILEKCKEMMN